MHPSSGGSNPSNHKIGKAINIIFKTNTALAIEFESVYLFFKVNFNCYKLFSI